MASRATNPVEGHANVEAGDARDVALVEAIVGEATFKERAASTIGFNASAILSIDTSGDPVFRNGTSPGSTWTDGGARGEATRASLPFGRDVATTAVDESQCVVSLDNTSTKGNGGQESSGELHDTESELEMSFIRV